MTAPAWQADPYAEALRTGRGPLYLRRADGWLLPLEVERWCAAPDAADLTVLRRCRGTVLDIGCGPGRLVAALAELGRPTLGIDISAEAVERTVSLGGSALRRSVFDPLPREGGWGTALLIDGNIGIGGDPRALLERVASLLAPDGVLLVETAAQDVDERAQVHVYDGGRAQGAAFPWARVGAPALLRHAREAGWATPPEYRVDRWAVGGRAFLALRRASRTGAPVPGPPRRREPQD
ncbi:class I SAM-dependent methyltransferase [Streptomyces sp. MUM 178J]|uniref:class I SAM-dependent methyltransferase n=1 Tax=Streptomyces sp. MUM 178J TaxID=2791991 RepID=UPI001F046E90|nr:methyltransferase domain-containing protein [Streptomyces sp. MUM 178J]WRQ80079.1 methyltransferase domain-containing protein [Streptomyces sp. MUM 178J]